MTATRRVRLSPDERREQLLELGVQLLATRTLEELSVESLAEEAGISRGLLFHYFRNKQEFHRAVVQRAADELIRVTEPDPSQPISEQISNSMAAYVGYVEGHYESYVSLVRGAASGDDQLRRIADDTRTALTTRITENLELLGLQPSAASRLAARGWTAYAEEIAVGWVADKPVSREELIRMLSKSLLAVLATVTDSDPAAVTSAATRPRD